jgi:membrane-associated protease RseP (regulator of RpoE activity)
MERVKTAICASAIAVGGVFLVVLVHEYGHFVAALSTGTTVPTFNVGIGPSLASIPIGGTVFHVRLLPIGGYVSFIADSRHAAQLSIEAKPDLVALYQDQSGWLSEKDAPTSLLIALGGVISNWLSIIVMAKPLARWVTKEYLPISVQALIRQLSSGVLVGPLTIFRLFIRASSYGPRMWLYAVLWLSVEIADFNLLPIVGFDGFRALAAVIAGAKEGWQTIVVLGVLCSAAYLLRRAALRVIRKTEAALFQRTR